jgi:hypothetical protein
MRPQTIGVPRVCIGLVVGVEASKTFLKAAFKEISI